MRAFFVPGQACRSPACFQPSRRTKHLPPEIFVRPKPHPSACDTQTFNPPAAETISSQPLSSARQAARRVNLPVSRQIFSLPADETPSARDFRPPEAASKCLRHANFQPSSGRNNLLSTTFVRLRNSSNQRSLVIVHSPSLYKSKTIAYTLSKELKILSIGVRSPISQQL